MDRVWIDVQMWTGLRGSFHPFTDVACPAPQPLPVTVGDWEQWATVQLTVVADAERWQAGRYHYRAEQRDEVGHPLTVFARGMCDIGA